MCCELVKDYFQVQLRVWIPAVGVQRFIMTSSWPERARAGIQTPGAEIFTSMNQCDSSGIRLQGLRVFTDQIQLCAWKSAMISYLKGFDWFDPK